jgi:hypothetical protein
MTPTSEATTAAVRQVLAILGRASDTWHNGDPAKSGPLHWPVAVRLATRELQQALGTLEAQPDEHTQDARAGMGLVESPHAHATPSLAHVC